MPFYFYENLINKFGCFSEYQTKFLALVTEMNPVKIAFSHYNVMSGNKPYAGSAVKNFNDN